MRNLPSVTELRRGLEDHDVLTSASAIAFQVLGALIPMVLVVLALLGFLDMTSVWENIALDLRPKLSTAAFTVLDDTVRQVLEQRKPFWLTLGLALAIWRLSAAMRAVMHALDEVYEADRERPLLERVRISVGLAIAIAVLLILAAAVVHLGPLVLGFEGGLLSVLSILIRWGLASVLVLVAIGLTIRYAPATHQPLGWVSFGSALAAACWLLASVAFGFYITELADYGSLFGSFATLFILLTYLYITAIALLAGAEADAQVRRRVDGRANGG